MTNLEKIQKMNAEEIYKWLDENIGICFSIIKNKECPFVPFCFNNSNSDKDCADIIKAWLESEVTDDTD